MPSSGSFPVYEENYSMANGAIPASSLLPNASNIPLGYPPCLLRQKCREGVSAALQASVVAILQLVLSH